MRAPMPETRSRRLMPCAAAFTFAALLAGEVQAHEAWLLTPDEMAALAVMPVPPVFTDVWPLAGFTLLLAVAALAAVVVADRLAESERRLFAPLAAHAGRIGPAMVRLGLGIMLGLAAVGGLPRHGTAPWTTPTLMVPDMQLALAGDGWIWLAYAELAVALALLAGLFTRAAAAGVIVLAIAGFAAFGTPFLAYGPHMVAPAIILLVHGGGAFSMDGARQGEPRRATSPLVDDIAWRVVMALLGGTFVYLGVVYKLGQPTLLIAILDHGDVPVFGLPLEIAALVMMLVEVTAGALLAFGLLVRPIALFLIGAFTFFAVTIGETPLFHANLYGAMAMLLMAGAEVPGRHLRADRPLVPLSPSRTVLR